MTQAQQVDFHGSVIKRWYLYFGSFRVVTWAANEEEAVANAIKNRKRTPDFIAPAPHFDQESR